MTPRVPLRAALARLRAGWSSVPVAGRLTVRGDAITLSDWSGRVSLRSTHPHTDADGVSLRSTHPHTGADGDIVSATLRPTGAGGCELADLRVLARAHAAPAAEDADLAARLPLLATRARVVDSVRQFFEDRGFVEVSTPHRVVCPGLEPHLVPLPAGEGRWLITSPELHLKRLVAAGAERVFEIARAWRGDEAGPWHLPEFALLEWYRAYEGLDALVDDVAALVPAAAAAAGRSLAAPLERLTVREAFSRYAGVDLAGLREARGLAAAAERAGVACAPGDTWDEIFFRVLVTAVEPRLGRGRLTILEEYPASQAALANVRDDPEWPVALRFEAYLDGIELANGFDELTDPVEQRRRHETDRAWRREHGREVPELDELFLAALAAGHPPAAGIALGLDRLVALVLGERDLARVVPFAR